MLAEAPYLRGEVQLNSLKSFRYLPGCGSLQSILYLHIVYTRPQRPYGTTKHAKSSIFIEQDDRCGNSSTQSQAPDDGYINVRNMLST